MATATSSHWGTSTRVAACSRSTRTTRSSSSTPRPFNRGASPSTSSTETSPTETAAPPRSGMGARRWSTSGTAPGRPRAGGCSTSATVTCCPRGTSTCSPKHPSPPRTARRSPWRATPARSSPSTSRPEPNSSRSAGLDAIVLWLKYSDDGELLVSGANDGGVSLWDATTLDLLGTVYPPHRGEAVPAGSAVHRRQPRRGHRVVRRPRLPVGDRPRPGPRVRLPDGRPEPDRGRVGRIPARPALPRGVPRALAEDSEAALIDHNL